MEQSTFSSCSCENHREPSIVSTVLKSTRGRRGEEGEEEETEEGEDEEQVEGEED